MDRRLAAILAADVVGYARLMGEDEAGTLERLKSLRKDLVQPSITGRKGRIVKLMGDGLLAEFPSVVEAVQCAVGIQQSMTEREAALPGQQRIWLRIGVNLGDVIVEGSDIYGDGVNVAARLEGLANPGGVCISGAVFEMIDGKLELDFEDIGAQQVKNIAKPVRAYRLATDGSQEGLPREPSEPLPIPDKPSIAVLPFTNLSGDPEQDYFADGITEDIITELSRFQSLFVIARNSVFAYKGRRVKAQEIGRDLGVCYVMEGSVRKAAERVRVTVQLIDSDNSKQIWAERYDSKLVDLFELQDELTQSIVATLPGRVESATVERAKRAPCQDVGVYDSLLRAKLCHHRGTREDNAEGLRLLDQALSTDPECASAYAWKGCTLAQAYTRGYIDYSDELEEEIYQIVLKGLSLDENDLECVRTLCEFRIEQNRLGDALILNEKALRINPNDPRIVAQRGEILTWRGHPEEGVDWIRKAMRLDPYGADSWAHLLGLAFFGARQYGDAIAAFKQVPIMRYSHHAYLAACHAFLDDAAQAKAESTEVLRLKPDFNFGNFRKTLYYEDHGACQHVRQGLVKAGLPE